MLIFALIQFVESWLPWLAPLAVSTLTGGVAGYGSFRFGQGELRQRVATLERDSSQFVTRNEFDLLHEDLKDIKRDVREIRRVLLK